MTLLSQILARRMHLPRAQTHDVVCRADLPVTMDDGAILRADRWVAAAAEAVAQPTVLVRSPYGRKQLVGMLFGRLLAERGLAAVVQSVRGTFGSEGDFSPFDERDDGLATLRWIRSQPWHDGRIGTIGPSYLGFVQWAIAGEVDAMAIQVSASQFYDQTYTGGSLSLETLASWMVILAAQERRLAPLAIGRALRGLQAVLAELPLGDLDERATGGEVPWFRQAFGDIDRAGPYWTTRDFSATVAEVSTPVSFVGGWYDILLPWMLADYETMQAAGRPVQLLIGPWTHTAPGMTGAGEREGLAWLRSALLADDRLVRERPVRLMVTGERSGGGWRELDRWPPPGTGEQRLYLDAGGALAQAPPDDRAGPARAGPSHAERRHAEPPGGDHYRYDPADPTPSLGGPGLLERSAVVDNAPLESRDDVLVYTTAPLPVTCESIGHVTVELWARASLPYFDLFARVCDVDEQGVSRNVCDALTGVAPGRHDQSPDGTWHVVWPLWPIGHRFAAGHRIRLQVSSGAHPRYARNPGTGESLQQAGAGTMLAVAIEILRDADHPSVLVLPTTP